MLIILEILQAFYFFLFLAAIQTPLCTTSISNTTTIPKNIITKTLSTVPPPQPNLGQLPKPNIPRLLVQSNTSLKNENKTVQQGNYNDLILSAAVFYNVNIMDLLNCPLNCIKNLMFKISLELFVSKEIYKHNVIY